MQSSLLSSTGEQLCLDVSEAGARLEPCTHTTRQIFVVSPTPSTPSTSFSLMTTVRDDGMCVTAPAPALWPRPNTDPECMDGGGVSGGEGGDFKEEEEIDLFARKFPEEMSRGYRRAYGASMAMMAKLRRRRQRQEKCTGGFGAPQGPFGEIYTTHTTIGTTTHTTIHTTTGTLTWRYVVGVQLSFDHNVSASDLALHIPQVP